MDNPSFPGFPWVGALLCGLFCLTVAALVGSAAWVRRSTCWLPIESPGRWNLFFGGLCLAFLLGAVTVGLPALAAVWVVLAPALISFTRRRDACVAASSRYLSGRGLANVVTDLKMALQDASGAKPTARLSIREQFSLLSNRVRAAAVKGRKQSSRTKGATKATKAKAGFAFLKKDGRVAIEMSADGDARGDAGAAVSDNVRNARDVIIKAIRSAATDVHLEPQEREYIVRLRVDGVLRDVDKMAAEVGKGLISALKVIADMASAELSRPEDGTFAVRLGDDAFDVRVASTTTSAGEKVVLRLLRSSGDLLGRGLGEIGLRPQVLKQVREIIHRPYGMFLVVGPTGSGKTTTVYASLSEIDASKRSITTVEDTVEYRLDGITQITANAKADISFASILRSVLQKDPDVLLVGEIRDGETAEIACQAALTGHFVFSTLHAEDAVGGIKRLLDMGLEPTLVQTAITAILGQRLARRLCTACKEPVEPPAGMIKKFNLKPGAVKHIYQEKGCPQCGGTGFRGQLGIHELLVMNEEIRSLIRPNPSISDIKKAALQSGMLTLQVDGLLKVIQGETSVNEILRVTA